MRKTVSNCHLHGDCADYARDFSIYLEDASMAIDEKIHECDEPEENPRPSWPFKSEDEEHRYFDDLQRVRDIRSAQ